MPHILSPQNPRLLKRPVSRRLRSVGSDHSPRIRRQRLNTFVVFMRSPVPCCEERWTDRWDTLWPGPSWWTPCRGTRAPPAPRPPGSRWRCSPAAGTGPARSAPSWAGRTQPAAACRCAGEGQGSFTCWTLRLAHLMGNVNVSMHYFCTVFEKIYKYLYGFFILRTISFWYVWWVNIGDNKTKSGLYSKMYVTFVKCREHTSVLRSHM